MTLTDFLLARIAEDEATARAATPGPWSFEWDQYDHTVLAAEPHPQSVHVTETGYDLSSRWVAETSYDDQSSTTYNSVADGEHIARYDPARVLRECEAKQHLVEEHALAEWDAGGRPVCQTCVDPDGWVAVKLPVELVFPCRTLRILASVYRDHPEYCEEWKP